MREITVKYDGTCRKCGADILAGTQAMYEKRVGVFCLTCAPTDTEEIREYRQEAADRKADKYDEWANKRIAKANATFKAQERFRGDIAFNTQPGHIPFRDRLNRQAEKAFENMNVARDMKGKAASLRSSVRVKGDADRKRQEKRDRIREVLKVGMTVNTWVYGIGVVEKINKTTAKIGKCGASGSYSTNVDLSFLTIIKD
jgi:hypothetical protein